MNLKELKNATVFLTGGTGFIGSALLRAMVAENIFVIALTRDVKRATSICRSPLVTWVSGDVTKPIFYEGSVDYIIHGASVTASKDFVSKPLHTITVAIDGTKNVLDFAVEKKVKKVVYLSSMEIYGVGQYGADPVEEENYGYLDLLDPRNSYPQSKRMCETICISYKIEQNVPVVIARLTQVFGGETKGNDQRMFAQFLRTASQGKKIILKTQGTTVRGYCHIEDTISALTYLLLLGQDGQAYNVCNPDLTMSVRDLAEKIASFYGTTVHLEENDQNTTGYLPPFRMVLSVEKLKQLGWQPKLDLNSALAQEIPYNTNHKDNLSLI